MVRILIRRFSYAESLSESKDFWTNRESKPLESKVSGEKLQRRSPDRMGIIRALFRCMKPKRKQKICEPGHVRPLLSDEGIRASMRNLRIALACCLVYYNLSFYYGAMIKSTATIIHTHTKEHGTIATQLAECFTRKRHETR